MPRAFVNGLTLHYQQRLGTGSRGSKVVLVHGLAANLALWCLRILPLLSQDLTIIVFDLRGHGHSDKPHSGYTTAHMAADLHGLLEYLESGPVHLVGHSFGGAVVLHYSVLHPERVNSVTLADSRIFCFQPPLRWRDRATAETRETFDHELGDQFLDTLGRADFSGGRREGSRAPFHSLFQSSRRAGLEARRWLELVRATTAHEEITSVAGLTVERIRHINQPVLLIYGEYSRCLPSCRQLTEELPRCKVVIVPRGGHIHPFVRPYFFVTEVTNFLREVAV